jgi:hypothetical protein
MFRLTRVIVTLRSEPFGFSSIITYSSEGCWSVWSGGCPYTDMDEILKTYIKKCILTSFYLPVITFQVLTQKWMWRHVPFLGGNSYISLQQLWEPRTGTESSLLWQHDVTSVNFICDLLPIQLVVEEAS